MLALGLIETFGLLPAVEAADAMLKSADVRLLEKNLADGGLVTITVAGETAAVQAAVEAGSAAVKRLSETMLVSARVIPRPDEELARILVFTPLEECAALAVPGASGAGTPGAGTSGAGTSAPAAPVLAAPVPDAPEAGTSVLGASVSEASGVLQMPAASESSVETPPVPAAGKPGNGQSKKKR